LAPSDVKESASISLDPWSLSFILTMWLFALTLVERF